MPLEPSTTPRHILTVSQENYDLTVEENNWDLTLAYAAISITPNSITSATTTSFTAGHVLLSNGTTVTSLSRSGIDTRTSFPNNDVTNATTIGTPDQLLRLNGGGNAVVNILIATGGVEAGEEGGDSGYFRINNTSGDAVTINNANASNAQISLPTGSGTLALTSSIDGSISSTDITDFVTAVEAAAPNSVTSATTTDFAIGTVLASDGSNVTSIATSAGGGGAGAGDAGKIVIFDVSGNLAGNDLFADGSVISQSVKVQGQDPSIYSEILANNITANQLVEMPDRSGSIALTEDYTAGTAAIDILSATVQGTLTANHIHGNLAGALYAHIRAGENLAKGDPVYVSGFHSGTGNAIVSKADASNAAKMPAIGIMDAAVLNNNNGHMVINGTISDVNTAAYAVNDTLYVASGGGFTATPPADNSQPVARVERVNTNNGAIIVKVNGLASSGNNGVNDANKLVRFDSIGGISPKYVTSQNFYLFDGSSTATLTTGTALTGNRTYTFPDQTGIVALVSNIPTYPVAVTVFLGSPTSANLRSAVTDETGSGSLVFATSPTLTSPTLAGTPNFTATSYTFASDARIGFLNNLSSQFVYKNGTIPFAEVFEDFPVTAGTHSFVTTSGTTAYYAGGSSSAARYWGAITMTTGAVADNTAAITLAPSGGAGGQTTSRIEMCHQVCFAINNATSSEFRARFAGGGQTFDCAVLFGTGVVQLEAANIGGAGINTVSVATGLTLAAGDFISGTRYRLFVRCVSATQTEVYLASAPWNSSTWTTLVDTTITHSTPTVSFASTQPFYVVTTKTSAARIAYVDWVAVRYAVQR